MNSPTKSVPSSFNLTLRALAFFAIAGLLALCASARAATLIWTSASGTDTNWSTGANWTNATAATSGTAPGSSDDVKFFNSGAAADTNTINNVADAGFSGTIASLQYGNTNALQVNPTNAHTTLIESGQTLNVTGTGGLQAGTGTDAGNTAFVYGIVKGAGTLNVNNTAANIVVNQGMATNGNNFQRATLNLSGLDNFAASVNRIGVGTTTLPGGAQNVTGTLLLAKTNIITALYPDLGALTNTPASTPTNAIEIGSDNGNAGGQNFLFLGQTNAFFTDSLGVGKLKTTSSMLFNSLFSNPSAYFRGQSGGSTRVRAWFIGDMASSGSSSSQALGTNNFTGGSVDAMVDTMILARDRAAGQTGSGATVGVLTFTSGTIDVNTMIVGDQVFGLTATFSNPMTGIVNVNGPTATLIVNTNLLLGNTTISSTAAARTSGTLNVRDGTLRAKQITVGLNSTNDVITMTNATLVLSNTIASPVKALTTLATTNSLFVLNVTTTTNITVTNLIAGGATNIINPASVAIFASYPAQIPLIKYTGAIGGVGFNFGFGANTLPPTAPGAYLSNNVANASIDLVIPCDPRPVITTQPSSYSGSPGDNVTFAATISSCSVLPLTYQWYVGSNPLSDGATGNGSTISGALTASLSITSAQPGDNGNYTLIVTNLYGSATSTPPANLTISSGCVPPSISGGPNNTTVVQGNNASFSGIVAGSPIPTLQWQRNGTDISGQTTAAYTLNNAQYPADDQVVISLVASNSCGVATNSATLTVIVPPSLSCQPTNFAALSGTPAAFSVCAGGVPAPGYQWKKNGADISGATSSSLTFAAVQPGDAATYSVLVTNTAGTILSSNATLIVNSSMAVTALSPLNGGSGICPDSVLRITFDSAPVIGTAGRIRIYNVTNTTTPVDTIDLALSAGNGAQSRTIAATAYNAYPIFISGNTALILPHSGVLTTNQTYYITVENVVSGTFKDSAGATFVGINSSAAWQFSTKPSGPANPANLTVAADGSGDFVTVQGAVDFIPANNASPVSVNIRNGLYQEIVFINSKNNIAVHGQDKNNTIISYPNNDPLNNGTSARPMFRARGNDITFDNLTLTNSTPKGGGQAEALRIDGQRLIFTNVFLASFQDTLLINNSGDSAYFWNCLIQGDTDFIWGLGTPYFQNCEIRALNAGHNTQMRTDASHYGATFADCLISKTNGATFTTHDLGRGIQSESDNGNANYLNCRMDTHITPAGWQIGGANQATVRYWEYQSVALDGVTPIDVSQRAPYSQQISAATALSLRNLTNAMAGWLPPIALNIALQPTNAAANALSPASFSVAANSILPATYQWRHEGTNVPGATAAMLLLPHTHFADAGNYDCVVTNVNGVLASSPATLTVNPTTVPAIATPSLIGGQLSFSVNGDTGPNYIIQASTNLFDWQTILTTNSPATPLQFSDPDTALYSTRFYRILLGP